LIFRIGLNIYFTVNESRPLIGMLMRNAQFEPRIIPKGQTISSKIEDAILGMYSRGMSTSDVCN